MNSLNFKLTIFQIVIVESSFPTANLTSEPSSEIIANEFIDFEPAPVSINVPYKIK